jgi:selenide,water dikinase
MAKGSGVTVNLDSKAVPLLPDVLELIRQGMLTRGDKNNRVYVGDTVRVSPDVTAEMQSALFDPQTSGGLLISLPEDKAAEFVAEVEHSSVIGSVSGPSEYRIEVA